MKDRPPSWIFFLLALPQGVYFGFVSTAMPWMMARAGVPVDQIASASAIINLPSVVGFVTAPLVDLGRHRRLWLLFGAGTSAVALLIGMLLPLPGGLFTMTVILTAGATLNAFVSSAVGALMTSTQNVGSRGMASGWFQAGNVGGGAVGGGVMLAVLQHASLAAAAVVGALSVLVPALAVLTMAEPEILRPATFRGLGAALFSMGRERRTQLSAIIFLSPLGACAFTYLFTAVADDYRAPATFVTLVNGFGGGTITAVGSILGGLICNRMERRRANIAVGAALALIAIAMMAAPMLPSTYAIGTTLYALVTGMCYTAYTALVLDVVGLDNGTGATRFAILNSAANLSVSYMIWADGQGYRLLGTRGMLGVDGGTGLVAAILIYAIVRRWGASAPLTPMEPEMG